jgi:hypothetical protein
MKQYTRMLMDNPFLVPMSTNKVRARSNSIKMSRVSPSAKRLQEEDEMTRETEGDNSLMGSQALLLQSSQYSNIVEEPPTKRVISMPLMISICAASLAMLAAGSQYAFSLYGPQVRVFLCLEGASKVQSCRNYWIYHKAKRHLLLLQRILEHISLVLWLGVYILHMDCGNGAFTWSQVHGGQECLTTARISVGRRDHDGFWVLSVGFSCPLLSTWPLSSPCLV